MMHACQFGPSTRSVVAIAYISPALSIRAWRWSRRRGRHRPWPDWQRWIFPVFCRESDCRGCEILGM